jgi:hypothetical protein
MGKKFFEYLQKTYIWGPLKDFEVIFEIKTTENSFFTSENLSIRKEST